MPAPHQIVTREEKTMGAFSKTSSSRRMTSLRGAAAGLYSSLVPYSCMAQGPPQHHSHLELPGLLACVRPMQQL
ncbi:hypothetical protein A6R68_21312, partial [Neotoma lepida]